MNPLDLLKIKKDLEDAQHKLNAIKNSSCKNCTWELIESEEVVMNPETKVLEKTGYLKYKPHGDGCQNPRRNGSAYCQECSDKHNK